MTFEDKYLKFVEKYDCDFEKMEQKLYSIIYESYLAGWLAANGEMPLSQKITEQFYKEIKKK